MIHEEINWTKVLMILGICLVLALAYNRAFCEPVVDSDGYLTITWDIPINHSTLTEYLIQIYNSEGEVKHRGSSIVTRYDWDYTENFIPGETVTVKVWALGVYVDAVGNIRPLKSSYASIDVTLNENTLLSAPLNPTVN